MAISTPSGGIPGMVSMIPQMKQFVNRVALALGNGFSPQLFWDSTGTSVNPAPTGAITGIAVDAHGVVTVTTSATLTNTDPTQTGFLPIGSNVIIAGVTNALYNGTFVVISVPTASTFTVQNVAAIGQAGSSGGTWTATTTPLINTFVPAYPSWIASSSYALDSIVQPVTPNGFYFKATQQGVGAASEPTWANAGKQGQQIADGTVIWTNQGTVQSSAPSPPGAGHIIVYAGSLWCWDTYPTDIPNGIDGPTSLRMSDVDNPFSWNPLNQDFVDKDDGTEGMGMEAFTISAEGIPPEGSLVIFKNYSGYQVVGVFGSTNFAIQKIRSDMGCTAPRTIKFVPGFGICRYAHLGVANFDGVRDSLLSEPIRPYLFQSNDQTNADITVLDPAWLPIAAADLTANPPTYSMLAPIGNSGGALRRIFSYDQVLKAWTPIDLPFSASTIYQARSVTATPVTLLGGFQDGLMQRWAYGDVTWLSNSGAPIPVGYSVQLPDVYGESADQKSQCRRFVIRGVSSGGTSLSFTPIINGVAKPAKTYPIPSSGDFELFVGVLKDGLRFSAIIFGSGDVELDRVVLHVSPKAIGTPMRVG